MEASEKMAVPEKKENRTGPIIGSIAAIVLCGLSGLCLLCPLSILTFTGTAQNATSSNFPQYIGILPLCVSILFIAIGIVVPILLLRKKKPAGEVTVTATPPDEPLPPAA